MAPKKKTFNGFAVFMKDTQEKFAKQGQRKSMQEMSLYCKNDWEKMPEHMKEKYKIRAKQMKCDVNVGKYTSIGEKVEDVERQSEDSKSYTNAMYSYIEELVRVRNCGYYLPKQEFILIHINAYTCDSEGFYFPAEISMIEFSLVGGKKRNFHQLLGFDKIRTNAPPAPTADINNHAKNYHKIDCFAKLPNNYTEILLKIIGFIIHKKVDEEVLKDPSLDMPPIYTAHSSSLNELKITSCSLFQLYQSAVKDACKDDFNRLLKVYHLDKLFMELKNVSYSHRFPNLDEMAFPSVPLASEALTKNMTNTIVSIGCNFHEKLEQPHICSNYYVCKWIYIICTHCCQFYDIQLVSGLHYDFDLSNPEVQIEEEFIENLNISQETNIYTFLTENKPKDLSTCSFPALEGGSSTIIHQPVWSRPEQKVNTHNKTESNNYFPPLGSSQKTTPKNISAENSWCTNAGRGRGIMSQVQNNNAAQISEKPSKLSKGRGFNIDKNK